VREGDVLKEAENGDFILCRTTMPLVKLFFHFLLKEKKAIIRGGEIGLSLVDMTNGIESIDDLKQVWQEKLDTYKLSLLAKGVINAEEDSAYTALEDKVLTLLFVARLSKNIEDLRLKIQSIFSDEIEGIILSTVHKAKGLEADRVFIVRPDLLPMTKNIRSQWEKQQENNLTYVAITRARKELVYDNKWTDED
jgi:superfamily I DNA/RNA helicase